MLTPSIFLVLTPLLRLGPTAPPTHSSLAASPPNPPCNYLPSLLLPAICFSLLPYTLPLNPNHSHWTLDRSTTPCLRSSRTRLVPTDFDGITCPYDPAQTNEVCNLQWHCGQSTNLLVSSILPRSSSPGKIVPFRSLATNLIPEGVLCTKRHCTKGTSSVCRPTTHLIRCCSHIRCYSRSTPLSAA